ncbi:Nicotinamide N-methyltransferase [Spironucleus salmonicida]|uniref:Nicotinamide N-methyltransferase n=1 Tax=Spironucleus salmonicida TaxID=348837 RepID=V6LBQ8_9EUKA|nr:Nicotinamide N-methyltransferase [Spironucleus salmonicida]|eukprot:EST41920.1 hypothetical protein SS50377_18224 [Spironucleus salmonicida]
MNFAESSDTPPPPTYLTYQDLKIRLIPDHSLWGHVLWNASKFICEKIQNKTINVQNKTVLEFGAGAAIPCIYSAKYGAQKVVATDFPEFEILENIQYNMKNNNVTVEVLPLLWGDTINQQFDIIFLCDLIFNHNEHDNLAKSTFKLLKDNGTAYCTFSHHQPNKTLNDLNFFDICKVNRLKCEYISQENYGRMFPEDDLKYQNYAQEGRENVYFWKITK